MFDLVINKTDLLAPLLTVAGALDKKQSLAILSNFLFKLTDNAIEITATDLEIEICARMPCQSNGNSGITTIPAKKFIDIIRALDENAPISLSFNKATLTIKQERSSFKLATLSAESYPSTQDECSEIELNIPRLALLQLLQSTHFAMSQQDVRFFLNGILMEFDKQSILAVGSDGHRLAISRFACENGLEQKILIPKKGVQELLRLLNHIPDEQVLLSTGKNHIKLVTKDFVFLSKLIEARFPPYSKAIPKNTDKQLIVDCDRLKRSLSRIVILAHEKSKGVLFHIHANQLTLIANNQEQEEAVDTIEAETIGEEIKIGLNAGYLIDVLNHFGEGKIRLSLSTTDSSILVEAIAQENYQYILMPMKI
jgi:DNA polymerase-3 subunit beta